MLGRCAAFLLGVAVVAGPVRGDEPAAPVVEYRDDALTVRLDNVALGQVLDALAHATGAEITGARDDTRTLSARFSAVPLAQALAWLLDGESFTLTYGDDGRPLRIELLGHAAPASPQGTTPPRGLLAPPPRPPGAPPAKPIVLGRPLSGAPPPWFVQPGGQRTR